VALSLKQKRTLYNELGQLLRSGKPLPAALEILAKSSSGGLRSFQKSLQKALAAGDSVSEAFAKQRPAIGEMEVSMLSAGGRSGRLMEGCVALSNYFNTLEKARAAILKKCAYPVFVFHFGILVLGLPTLVGGGGVATYLKQTFTTLGIGYAFTLIPVFIVFNLLSLAQTSALADRFFLAIPGTGKVRRSFALARFCATYDAQLEAAVNVMDSLKTAAEASHSAVIIQAIAKRMPALREGQQVGQVLADTGVFPEWLVRAFRVAEETGGLDRELPQMAIELESQALSRVETLSEWVPRLIYLGVMLLMGWRIIALYKGVTDSYGKLLDF
jgi:type IV pilus assembly protein PilC